MNTILISDIHAGRSTDSQERQQIKRQAMQNIAQFICNARITKAELLGDLTHGLKPDEFDSTVARNQLRPLFEALDSVNAQVGAVVGNWDPIPSMESTAWPYFTHKHLQDVLELSKDRDPINRIELVRNIDHNVFTHGHIGTPSLLTALKGAITGTPQAPNVHEPLERNGPEDDTELLYEQFRLDHAQHQKADKILALQEWGCKLPGIGVIARFVRSRLDQGLQFGFSQKLKAQFDFGEEGRRLVMGHTHTAINTPDVLNPGTAGADMRPYATFALITEDNQAELYSAWHPEVQDAAVPLKRVQHAPVPKHLQARDYVLDT